jgi:hypothetical protein
MENLRVHKMVELITQATAEATEAWKFEPRHMQETLLGIACQLDATAREYAEARRQIADAAGKVDAA